MRSSSCKPAFALACAGLLGALTALAPRAAHANGRYPAAGLIAIDPSDEKHIVVRTTYGLLSTQDGGGTWSWVCEQSVGFSDNEDPMVAITANGTLLAGVFKGLSVSTDRACDWTMVGGELEGRFVVDLSTEKLDPSRAVAILSNGIGGGKFNTQVYETADNGATWTKAGVDLPQEFLGLTIDAAPSDPQRLYASGRFGSPDYTGVLQRTDDRGKTWQSFPIPGADDQHPPYLSAVDPNDPDIVYVRLDGVESDILVVSKDGGETWTTAFEGKAGLFGFALSPDGGKVAIGGDKDGLWMAPAGTLAFTKVSEVEIGCLHWHEDTLYACADQFADGFHVGFSKDEGKTFQALEHLTDICPLECPAGTTTGEKCPVQWGAVALTLNIDSCEEPEPTGGAGGTGGEETGSPGCACSAAGEGLAGRALLFGSAALLAGLRRARRTRRILK